MEKLTREEVLHVAHLARVGVTEEEIEKYSRDLQILMNDIDKIKDVPLKNENIDILVTPVDENSKLREDNIQSKKEFNEFKENVASSVGKFVRVPVINND